ncbi:Alpha-soluble NSF attachment protein [Trichoplax sp. H2]|uniref:Alpha-soluble NSF attachment protein n=1 Tax=Trichoplax adhaerens TaxID=10228 RepID=B3SAL0_TRIAD|nr:hypothetical protein TRIADDRAFT_32131 [Trichoplax adhaerens]EDV20331.1 hypothetical protein TRIADDRAFT_32131 [Trichoplax adhaerens]RDD38422.1 Alpha-soluble NSF attachment protein [Trichoplax sp. H2]|eukprot:XP_002117281.1 hypothetical protein TRIADDRAFT_32131 [Trichoplax adhaerens]
MADVNEQKGFEFVAQAQKREKSSQGFFGSIFGGGATSKLEDACDLYQRAGNSFKMAKKWSEAAGAFCEAARLKIHLQSRHEAASFFVDAATCFKKSEPEKAIESLNKAVEIFTDMGRFSIAAKHHISIAEIYENELTEVDKAMANYEKAADYYRGEDSTSSANKCLLRVAMYAAQLEDYRKAIEIYEEVAAASLENTLLKYSCKEYFFKASLCHMCQDFLDAKHAAEKYCGMYPAFQDSRECKLIEKLICAGEEENVDEFTDHIKDYDKISRLDQWTTTLLLRIKKRLGEEPELN